MATQPAESRLTFRFSVLLFLIFIQFVSADQTNIRTEPGQNVTLPCEAARNKNELIIDWSKPDLGENDHVALYRDDKFDYHGQNPYYKNRVDLQDREIKNRDVSLVLKNVTINDTGKYECRVHPRESNRRKRSYLKNEPICDVTLHVSAPGSNDTQIKDGGNEEGQENNGGNNTALIVGLLVGVPAVLVLFAVSGFLLYKKQRRSSQEQNQPPAAEAELQSMNAGNNQEPGL